MEKGLTDNKSPACYHKQRLTLKLHTQQIVTQFAVCIWQTFQLHMNCERQPAAFVSISKNTLVLIP